MLNKDKVRGIVRARQGSQIPKFQTPAGASPILGAITNFRIENGKYYVNGQEVTKEQYEQAKIQKNQQTEDFFKGQVGGDLYNSLSENMNKTASELDKKTSVASPKIDGKVINTTNPSTPPEVDIVPQNFENFQKTFTGINPENVMQEYYRYKNNSSIKQPYEPLGGNFSATGFGLQQLTQLQQDNQNSSGNTKFSLPEINFDAITKQALYGDNSKSQYDFSLPWLTNNNSQNFGNDSENNYNTEGSETDPPGDEGGEEDEKGPSLKEKISNFGLKHGKTINTVGQVADTARGLLFANQAASDSNTTSTINNAYDAISTSLMGFAPVGTVIGGAMKVGALLGDGLQALGGGTDQMTTTDQIMDSSLFSWNIGAINGFAGKTADKFSVDRNTLAQVGSSYQGTAKYLEDAASKSGKKYGLFSSGSRRSANRQMADARVKQNTMTGIANTATDQRAMKGDHNYLNYRFNLSGGYDQRYMRAAKSGMKLQDKIDFVKNRVNVKSFINLDTKEIEWNPIIEEIEEWESVIEFKEGGSLPELWEPEIELVEEWEPIITDYVEEFKDGGSIKEELETPEIEETNQKNLIPEGALHKNKHHIEHTEGLTQKGIPVIDNSGEQQAEIELDEIIFTLEVTKKLEELYKEGTDEAAIEAGKLLVKEILFNTDDRTGLIAKCEKGGVLNEIG